MRLAERDLVAEFAGVFDEVGADAAARVDIVAEAAQAAAT